MGAQLADETRQPKTRQRRRGRISVEPGRRDLTGCVHSDQQLQRRWSGVDVDLSLRLPSDLIMAAAEVDPAMNSVVRPYQAMLIPPNGLAAVEPRAREIYASGWRPPIPAGPTRDELADLAARSEVATFPPRLPAA